MPDLRKETRRGSSVYNGIFNLLVLRGARDWTTGNVPQYGELDDHHIVPKDWGRQHPGVRATIDTILNRTPLTAETNRHVMRERLPNEYLPQMVEANGQEAVLAILDSHYVSPAAFAILLRKPFTPADFDEFLGERQRTIQDAIESLLIKDRLDLSPSLRELDERVEKVELSLRSSIVEILGGDPALVPPHILQRVGERLQAQARRNPAFDAARYATLSGRLEYCDLRDLQEVITSKALWPRFDQRFGTKEALVAKFGQLAELRNGLRHTRSVDEITRKEGEAALLWFDHALRR